MVKEFQITDIREKNEDDNDETVGDYVIDLFGRCENREDIYVKVINYRPYFYILIPEELQNKSKCDLEMYVEKLKTYFKSKDCKIKCEVSNKCHYCRTVRKKFNKLYLS